jgi:hypothetical protein
MELPTPEQRVITLHGMRCARCDKVQSMEKKLEPTPADWPEGFYLQVMRMDRHSIMEIPVTLFFCDKTCLTAWITYNMGNVLRAYGRNR